LNILPLLLGVTRFEIAGLPFQFAVMELEAFEGVVVLFLRILGVLSAGNERRYITFSCVGGIYEVELTQSQDLDRYDPSVALLRAPTTFAKC
jgi:hypothetical protein